MLPRTYALNARCEDEGSAATVSLVDARYHSPIIPQQCPQGPRYRSDDAWRIRRAGSWRARTPSIARRVNLYGSTMAIFHRATITPTKAELIGAWAPGRAWGPAAGSEIDLIGSYRFDDPEGRVGMETFLALSDGLLFQIPLTYRDEPLVDGEGPGFISEMQHSVLGTRWVYDGL